MTSTSPKEFPTESYMRDPEQPFRASDYVFQFAQLTSFYDVPGEFGHLLEGQQYGFESLSFIITETYPGGGPPLHTHESEEAHVLLEGEIKYVIGDQRFTVSGPFVVRIPAGVPHTFLNASQHPFRIVCVFPDNRWTYQEVGPNPLIET